MMVEGGGFRIVAGSARRFLGSMAGKSAGGGGLIRAERGEKDGEMALLL